MDKENFVNRKVTKLAGAMQKASKPAAPLNHFASKKRPLARENSFSSNT